MVSVFFKYCSILLKLTFAMILVLWLTSLTPFSAVTSGVMMSSYQYLLDDAVSPGSVKLLRVVMAMLWRRPTPASSMPPHQSGIWCFLSRSWIFFDWVDRKSVG